MKKIHQQKWFQIGLPIVLVVVVAAGAIWYATGGEVFQGDLGKILTRKSTTTDTSSKGQAAIEAYEAAHSNGVTEEECKLYKEWSARCEYTCRKDDGNITPLTACQQKAEFKDYMNDWPTDKECTVILAEAAKPLLPGQESTLDPADVAYCETAGCLHTPKDKTDDAKINAKCEAEQKNNV